MRAIAFDEVGGADMLHEVELPVPEAGPGQVLIRVAYAGLNFAEVFWRRGSLGPVAGPTVPGLEVSGHVAALGAGVSGPAVGAPVAAFTHPATGASGGYAEYAVAPADLVHPLGPVDLRTGAAFPCVVVTAYGLLSAGGLRAGETVLVHGAAGGVGSVVGPLARELGAGRVLGTVGSAAKQELAVEYGYHAAYLRDGFAAAVEADGHRVDLVLDAAGSTRNDSLELLRPGGRLVVYGNTADAPDLPVSSDRLWHRSISVIGYSVGALAAEAPDVLREQARRAMDLFAAGRIPVRIAEVLPLGEAARAHRALETGTATGKLLLAVDPA
jgi:NADPH:quinone reductase